MDLELTRYFVKVVQNGSFSKAADVMNVPKSTVSKAISRLEGETGTKLLLRTTRSLTLTAAGRAYFNSCLGPIQALEDAQKSLHGTDSIVSGVVKITAPEDLGVAVIAPVMASLSRRHPGLAFELLYTDEVIDLIKEGFDLAIRIGRPAESSFKIKRLGEVVLVAVASPGYLKGRERIRNPKDLAEHDCLSFRDASLSTRWNLRSKKESSQVAVKPRIASNQMTSLLKMALSDGGIAFIPRYLCRDEIDSGRLVDVLPGWTSPGLLVSMITPLATNSSARLKITADELSKSIPILLER